MAKPKPSTLKPEKLFYGITDAAYALSVSKRTIEYMIADQRLRTRRLGSRVLIPAEDLHRLADLILRSDMLQGSAQVRT